MLYLIKEVVKFNYMSNKDKTGGVIMKIFGAFSSILITEKWIGVFILTTTNV